MTHLHESLTPEEDAMFAAMVSERVRQLMLHGAQLEMQDLPKDIESFISMITTEAIARHNCQVAFRLGDGSWAHVLLKEVTEVFQAESTTDMRKELIEVATVCMSWIEAIDHRADCPPDTNTED